MIPDYLAAFGLAFDPFEANAQPTEFFVGAGREEVLEQLLHLIQFSDSVCVVEGDDGSGRTTLRHELAAHFEAGPAAGDASVTGEALAGDPLYWCVCDLDAARLSGPEQLFAQLAEAIDCPVSEGAATGELLAALRQQLQNSQAQPVLLLLDDAHRLDDAVLSALLSLGQTSAGDPPLPLHTVLLGELGLTERLDGFGMVDLVLQDLVLPLLTLDDLAEYLFVKLSAAGWQQSLPFDEDELNRLLAVSKGVPGGVHEAARAMLMEKAEAQADDEPRGLGLPVAHMFSLVVLLGILLMAFFYKDSWFTGESPQSADTAPVQTQESRRTVPVPLTEPQPRTAPEARPPLPASPQVEAPASATNTGGSSSAAGSPEATSEELEAQAAPTIEPEQPAIVQGRDEATIVKEGEALAGQSSPVPNAAPPVPEMPTAQAAAYSADEQALLDVDGSRYVLQVMAASSKASVEAFVQRQSNRKDLKLFTSRRAGKPWFVVVAGTYPSLEAARKGVALLPSEQRKAGPWPRRVAEVQSKIRDFHSI